MPKFDIHETLMRSGLTMRGGRNGITSIGIQVKRGTSEAEIQHVLQPAAGKYRIREYEGNLFVVPSYFSDAAAIIAEKEYGFSDVEVGSYSTQNVGDDPVAWALKNRFTLRINGFVYPPAKALVELRGANRAEVLNRKASKIGHITKSGSNWQFDPE